LLIIQTLSFAGAGLLACVQLYRADLFWFLPFDLFSIIIAVIILNFIILVTGVSAALTNISFAWFVFHVFVVVLFIIELLTPSFVSDISGLVHRAHTAWLDSTSDEIRDLQSLWGCCGFENMTDKPVNLPCPTEATQCCHDWLTWALSLFRNITVILLFLDFVFALLVDFAACGLCCHPQFVTLNTVRMEEGLTWGSPGKFYRHLPGEPSDDLISVL
jgi:hypothetical protein